MTVELIPREILFGNPERAAPVLSPDGAKIAFLAPDEGVLNLFVAPSGDLGAARAVTSSRHRPILTFSWLLNSAQLVYLHDRNGDENHHAYRIEASGGAEPLDLTPFDGVQVQGLG